MDGWVTASLFQLFFCSNFFVIDRRTLQGTSKEAPGLKFLKNFFGILNFGHQVALLQETWKTLFGTFEGFLTKKVFFSSRHILTRISSRIFWGLDPACTCHGWRTARKVSSGQSRNSRLYNFKQLWSLNRVDLRPQILTGDLFFRENFFSFWRLFFFVSEKKKFILRLFPALKTTKLRTRARRDKISPLGAWWAAPCRVGQVKFSPFCSTKHRFRDKWPQSFT